MKRFIGIVLIVAILLVVTIGALQSILAQRLRSLLSNELLPDAQQAMGVAVSIRDSGLNMLGGSVHVKDLAVSNPEGFVEATLCSVNRLQLNIGWKGVLAGDISDIARLRGEGTTLTIVRGKDRQFNLAMLGSRPTAMSAPQALPPVPPPGADPTIAPPSPSASHSQQEHMTLHTVMLDPTIHYIDHHLETAGQPFELTLKLFVTGTNITIGPAPSLPWGTVSIRGSQADNSGKWVTRIEGHVAPLSDPQEASFELAGRITAIDMQALRPYIEESGLLCDELNIDVCVVCRQGNFDPQKSTLSLDMRNVTLTTNLVAELPDELRHMDSLVLPLPLAGTLRQPETDLAQALVGAALRTLKQNPELILKAALKGLLQNDSNESEEEGSRKKSTTRDLLKDLQNLF
jgi:hypothetical protein